ncbi:type II secretion system protein [Opitutaceae bacterium TAV4]|nr:type II secretion system protein [Opitutaceae bacterium TAV4]RRJ99777.1 type II secretion system protein [Opitutaceae bacterium TAV3]
MNQVALALPKKSQVGVRSAAFTLIELLAVIAIIGVLSAIVLAVIGRARIRARDTVCVSNLRQIFLALENYATENKGVWPAPLAHGGSGAAFLPVRWVNDLRPIQKLDSYLMDPKVMRCPTVVAKELRGPTELEYWYGLRISGNIVTPDRLQDQERAGTPYPSLVWCTWPQYVASNANLHGDKATMHVARWNGGVVSVSAPFRNSSYP